MDLVASALEWHTAQHMTLPFSHNLDAAQQMTLPFSHNLDAAQQMTAEMANTNILHEIQWWCCADAANDGNNWSVCRKEASIAYWLSHTDQVEIADMQQRLM